MFLNVWSMFKQSLQQYMYNIIHTEFSRKVKFKVRLFISIMDSPYVML